MYQPNFEIKRNSRKGILNCITLKAYESDLNLHCLWNNILFVPKYQYLKNICYCKSQF